MRPQNIWRSTIITELVWCGSLDWIRVARLDIKASLRSPESWITALLNLNWTAKLKHCLCLVHPILYCIRQIKTTKDQPSSCLLNPMTQWALSTPRTTSRWGQTPLMHLSYLSLKRFSPALTTLCKLQLPRMTGRGGSSTTTYTIISTTQRIPPKGSSVQVQLLINNKPVIGKPQALAATRHVNSVSKSFLYIFASSFFVGKFQQKKKKKPLRSDHV